MGKSATTLPISKELQTAQFKVIEVQYNCLSIQVEREFHWRKY
jgi:hypothetical protein